MTMKRHRRYDSMDDVEKELPNYWSVIPATVRYDDTLTPSAKLLYGEISSLSNVKGYCWATNRYFADLYGAGISTVSKWVSALQESGHIVVTVMRDPETGEVTERRIQLVHSPPNLVRED